MEEVKKCRCPGVMRDGCPCDKCHGRGWYPDSEGREDGDYLERYCDCEDGDRRRKADRP